VTICCTPVRLAVLMLALLVGSGGPIRALADVFDGGIDDRADPELVAVEEDRENGALAPPEAEARRRASLGLRASQRELQQPVPEVRLARRAGWLFRPRLHLLPGPADGSSPSDH
jgi:hypothetical protein